jgi:hypothetical protein
VRNQANRRIGKPKLQLQLVEGRKEELGARNRQRRHLVRPIGKPKLQLQVEGRKRSEARNRQQHLSSRSIGKPKVLQLFE